MSFRAFPLKAVTDIHDGDTITVHIDKYTDQCQEIDLRLLGVFAAELRDPGGPAARRFVVDWFAAHPGPLTCYTYLSVRGNERKTLGRWVGDVHDDITDESLCVAIQLWLLEHPDSAGGTGAT